MLVGGAGELHAAAAAAGGRLDDDRVADRGRRPARASSSVGTAPSEPGHAGHAERLHRLLGGDLVAHQPDVLGGRADEGEAVVLDDLHEGRVLGEEAVARVDRLGAGDLAGGDDVRASTGSSAPPAAGRCRRSRRPCARAWRSESAVEWIATVWMPISLQARWMRSAISPRLAIRTLLNIGGQLAVMARRRGHSRIISGAPNSTGEPSSTRMRLTRPARGAGIWFIVFIASMIRMVCPSVTASPTLTKAGASGSACR